MRAGPPPLNERNVVQATSWIAIGGAAVIAAGFCVLAIAFLGGERARGRLLVQYQAERVATGLFVIVAQAAAGDIPNEQLAAALRRAATYDARGRIERIRIGNAPLRLDEVDIEPGEDRFLYDQSAETLTIIRRRWLPEPLRGARNRGLRVTRNEFVLVEIDAAAHFSRDRSLLAAQLLLPLAVGGLTFGAVRLVRANTRYRQQLGEQRQLVQLGEAARTLAHEIKNPLSAIQLSTGLLRRQAASEPTPSARRNPDPLPLQTGLDHIDAEVSRLAMLADRMGDFIRDPVGSPTLHDVHELLKGISSRYQSVTITSSLPGELFVSADQERLRSVLDNLVTNAVESGGDGGV